MMATVLILTITVSICLLHLISYLPETQRYTGFLEILFKKKYNNTFKKIVIKNIKKNLIQNTVSPDLHKTL